MLSLIELCTYLKELLQADLFEDYCPNGLQVEGKDKVKKGAFAVSASLAVIEQAKKWGADFLFTHHGIFWNRDPYPLIGTKKEKIRLLLEGGISLLSYHLPLDAHPTYGNNWKAANDLGWKELQPFSKVGVVGKFKETSFVTFQKQIEAYYGQRAHIVPGGKKKVSSAALISGGAHKEILHASRLADCFITGSFDEPTWHQAYEEKINFLALGHSTTEKIGPKAIKEHLKEKFGFETRFIEENNPF